MRRDCIDAKEALSFDAETVVPVLLPGAQARVRLVRSEFEQMIDGDLRRTLATLRRAVEDADLELDELTAVLLIGGSSRIPAIAQLISAELELPVAVDADPKASISMGAAAAGARTLDVVPAVVEDDGQRRRDAARSAAPALVGAPVGASAAVLPPHRMSLGLRATVLAGVAAALLAVLIPITPLAMGTQEQPDDGTEGTSGEPNGAPAGQYSTGAAPLLGPVAPVFQLDEGSSDGRERARRRGGAGPPALAGQRRRRRCVRAGAERIVHGCGGGDAGGCHPGDRSRSSTRVPRPTRHPSPCRIRRRRPVPDPVQDPAPDPVPDPSPEPVPDPSPSPEPTPDPAPETTEPAPSVP